MGIVSTDSPFFVLQNRHFWGTGNVLFYCVPLLKNNITMLCKYYIKLGSSTIGDTADECLEVSDCIKNLDSLKVSYTRNGLGGVVRKCGSEIEFTGKAYDAIVGYYGENYLQSEGVFAVFIADNNWRYTKLWDCPLDFATLHYDGYVVTIGCVDNGVAAIIKANKKQKYEFDFSSMADTDQLKYSGVITKRSFKFNVVGASAGGTEMKSSLEVGWKGCNVNTSSQEKFSVYKPAIGTSYDSFQSQCFVLQDQQEGNVFFDGTTRSNWIPKVANGQNGFVKCVKAGIIHIKMDVTFRFATIYNDHSCRFFLVASSVTEGSRGGVNREIWSQNGSFSEQNHIYIDDDFYLGTDQQLYFGVAVGTLTNSNHSFDLGMRWGSNTNEGYTDESEFQEKPTMLKVTKPEALLQSILDKMFEGLNVRAKGIIESDNNTLNRCLILPAESIRQFKMPKVYSSFNEFSQFMENVFGFVYQVEKENYLMDRELELYDKGVISNVSHIRVGSLVNELLDTIYTAPHYKMYPFGGSISVEDNLYDSQSLYLYEDTMHWGDNVFFDETHNVFVMCNESTGIYHSNWKYTKLLLESSFYNEGGVAKEHLGLNLAYWKTDGSLYGLTHKGSIVMCDSPHLSTWLSEPENTERFSVVRFTHRDMLFTNDVCKVLKVCNDFGFEFYEDKVYSQVEVGYTQKDYQNENSAKNEYNFTNYYSTGVTITDNTLSLISPYRSDCYGIEELLTKKKEDESTSSDDDIFIVIAKHTEQSEYVLDKEIEVQNAYTDTVFNAALAPNIIVLNNESLIGTFSSQLNFTSSDGNSNAIIGTKPMNANLEIGKQLFRAGKLTISTGDVALPEDWNGLIEFEYNGKTYRGYLESVDINFAYTGTLTYNLIEKCIE